METQTKIIIIIMTTNMTIMTIIRHTIIMKTLTQRINTPNPINTVIII